MDAELLEQRRQLEAGFASENWTRLSLDQKLTLCRELENNYATECGVSPCYVTAVYMDDCTYGYQSNRMIVLNAHVLERGAFFVTLRDENNQPIIDQDGQPMERFVPVPATNWSTMETVYHEGTHGVQEAEGRLAWTYIDGEQDYSLYRLQSCEKEAFSAGRLHTLDAIRVYETSGNPHDPSVEHYLESISGDSFRNYVDDAATRYNDPNIEETLSQFISDRDNGVIPDNPSESYQAIALAYDRHNVLGQENSNSASEGAIELGAAVVSPATGTNAVLSENNKEIDVDNNEILEIDVDSGYGVNCSSIDEESITNGAYVDDGYGVDDIAIDDGYGVDNSGMDYGPRADGASVDEGYSTDNSSSVSNSGGVEV